MQEHIADFENYIKANIPHAQSFHPHYQDAIAHVILAGGKRFRPQLVFAVVSAYAPDLVRRSYPAAYAHELLHTYSLIHDDLPAMDNAPLRRGKPTLHALYGEVTAVLVGDALNTHAFFLLATCDLPDATKTALVANLAYSGGLDGMVLGQAIDCHFENQRLNLEQLEFLHRKKTGELIAASLKAGAIICGLDATQTKAIYSLGLKLGLVFQIQDDIIDATATQEEAGKPVNNDSAKNTFINLAGLDGAVQKKLSLTGEIKEILGGFNAEFKENLMQLINKYLS